MNDIGLKARILLMTLIPTGAMILALGSYFSWQAISELNQQLLERGFMTVEHLQDPAAAALLRGEPEQIRKRLSAALNRQDVRAVSLYDSERNVLEHSGPLMHQPERTLAVENLGAGTGLQVRRSDGSSRFLLPLLASSDLIDRQEESSVEPDALLGWLEVELSHGNIRLRQHQVLLHTLVIILVGLTFTGLVVSSLGRRISDPIAKANHAVSRISRGQLDVRLEGQDSRELDDLANGINAMAETLQSAQGELQQNIDQATEDLRQTLETIEVQNIELDMARKTALEASRIKSEFLANMSHELRTPLNGIIGFSHLLQRTELSNRQQEYLGTIGSSADNLLAIINEILDFSKIEAGKLILDNLPFNLRDLIQDTLTMLAPAAHHKNLELVSIIYRDTPLGLSGDALRLKQILANLISNAIKFTHTGSVSIRTMLEHEDETHVLLRISVTDTGAGLTASQQKRLFQAFSQADNSISRQAGGTGLGLTIAKRLVEQMQGEIGLNSQPAEGSEFWFTVRLEKSSQASDDLPYRPLEGVRAGLVEPLLLSRQALLHCLEDLGLGVSVYDSPALLEEDVIARKHSEQAIDLMLLSSAASVNQPEILLDLFKRRSAESGCKTILLIDTTEHYPALDQLPASECQVLSRPLCTRKVLRAINRLFKSEPASVIMRPAVLSQQVTILCVDDNEANLKLVATFLSQMGAHVLSAKSGEQALDLLTEETVDLIFMDVQMPGMDGRAATSELRLREKMAGSKPLPVIALTAHALAEERRKLLQCGMNDYMSKPISPEQLAHCVQRWTGVTLDMPAPEDYLESTPNRRLEDRERLAVLDREVGLRLAAGKEDLEEDMLRMLIESLPDERLRIEQYITANATEELLEVIHKLHGACRYCGVPQLRACCQQAEELLKRGQPTQVAVSQLIESITRLQAAYATESV
ncbi:response regulator [uncultured Halopseudomonas sp.]|uniref:response regulator n=1 Tax=uncultured Halopseudomonas sp. TaxID=2901193 RepID=UPI0030EB80CD|tara:strand:+ start:25506 stop:28295 length:2790 start_codon:yes stop_codon:yes gene_type:complete